MVSFSRNLWIQISSFDTFEVKIGRILNCFEMDLNSNTEWRSNLFRVMMFCKKNWMEIKIKGNFKVSDILTNSCFEHNCSALTMKGQNIGSSTKKIYKQTFDSDILDSNNWKYMYLGSFKSHTYCSIAKNGSVVVYQN